MGIEGNKSTFGVLRGIKRESIVVVGLLAMHFKTGFPKPLPDSSLLRLQDGHLNIQPDDGHVHPA